MSAVAPVGTVILKDVLGQGYISNFLKYAYEEKIQSSPVMLCQCYFLVGKISANIIFVVSVNVICNLHLFQFLHVANIF